MVDQQGQVQSFVRALTYSLDEAGNRTSVHDEVSGGATTDTAYAGYNNRYDYIEQLPIPPNPEQILYDDRGNLAWDKHFLYVYDFKDRLSEVWLLVEDEETAEQTRLGAVGAFRSQQLAGSVADLDPLYAARQRVLERFEGDVGRIATDVVTLQRRGFLTERVALAPGARLTTASGAAVSTGAQTAGTSAVALQPLAIRLRPVRSSGGARAAERRRDLAARLRRMAGDRGATGRSSRIEEPDQAARLG
ncbi:MAG: hypothetical protein IPM29_17235 [Planctomycetes bacterium]|nr:hypothetical protein [Planctomycetota bacterium]